MPGIIGVVARRNEVLVDYLDRLKSKSSKPFFSAGISQSTVNFQAETKGIGLERAVCKDDGAVSVLLYGHCFDATSGNKLDSRVLIDRYRSGTFKFLDDLEGAFHIVICDQDRGKLLVINDRLGTLPLYWTQNNETIRFSHKLKLLGDFGERDIDETGLLTFLISGYCYLDRTLFKNVRYLTPASILSVDLESLKTTHQRYWNLVYRPNHKADPRELCRRLDDAITRSVELFMPDGANCRGGLFLSGGWDSKGVLGTMIRQHRPPTCVVTNGESDYLPYSDTFIARQIAENTGIPFRLNTKNPHVSKEIIREGVDNCELITDTSPEVFGQHRIPASIFEGLAFMFKGDEVWGWQDYAFNRQQAIGHVMANTTSPTLHQVLSPSASNAIWDHYNDEIERVWATCENENWNDRKDYLYLYGRVNRYIFGLGDSDEQHIEVRRPYLTKAVLDVMMGTLPEFRVQKNLFKQMMITSHPRLVAFGDSYTSSIPDYYHHMRSQITDEATGSFQDGIDFGGLIRPGEAISLVNAFAPGMSSRAIPSSQVRIRKTIENRWLYRIHRTPIYRRKAASQWEQKFTQDDRIVFRLWLLCRYLAGNEN